MNRSTRQAPLSKKTGQKSNQQQQQSQNQRSAPSRRPRKSPNQQMQSRVPRPLGGIPAAYTSPFDQYDKGGSPKFSFKGKTVTVRHSEFFFDVNGTTGNFFFRFLVSPSSKTMFPWLSTMAGLFESYQFNSLRVRYKNRVGTSTGGTFAMAHDYDCNDAFPLTKGELLANEDKADCVPYEPTTLVCSTRNLHKRQSLYTGATPVGKDANLYALSHLTVFTSGNPATTQIGELYVDYDITFSTPQGYIDPYPNGVGGGYVGTSNVAPFATEVASSVMSLSGTVSSTVSTGSTTSVTTWTFAKAWKGYLSVGFIGTGLSPIAEAGSTATVVQIILEYGTATGISSTYQVSAHPGETIIITMGNTTITNAVALFGSAPNPLA